MTKTRLFRTIVLGWRTQFRALLGIVLILAGPVGASAEKELIRDSQFQRGFYLLEPQPGKRVVYGQVAGPTPGNPVWDLAQWSSKFPLLTTQSFHSDQLLICSNGAKRVVCAVPGNPAADLSLGVNAGAEYGRARLSSNEPWVHLLVQQDFLNPPSLAELASLDFHLKAKLNRSRLVTTNDYSPARHAAQYLVYLTVANRNPNSPGYQECFWFGIPVYDNRHRVVPAYEARDFGGTRLFIFTPSSDTFASKSTHDGEWVTLAKDILPLLKKGIEQAKAKGFFNGSGAPADYRPMGIFIGWELPGAFDVELQIRNLSLKMAPLAQKQQYERANDAAGMRDRHGAP
jgi:hypothetical protein